MICKEFKRGLEEILSYKKVFIMDFIIMTGIFVMILLSGNGYGQSVHRYGQEITSVYGVFSLLSYAYWMTLSTSLSSTAYRIISDSMLGIFTLRIRGKYSYGIVNLGDYFVSLFSNLLILFIIILLFLLSKYGENANLINIIKSLIFLPFSFLGTYGLGLAIGGFSLIQKKIGSFLLLINGTFLFIIQSPLLYNKYIQIILPFAKGIKLSRDSYFGVGISYMHIVELLLVNFIWFGIGYIIFKKSLILSRKYGTIMRK